MIWLWILIPTILAAVLFYVKKLPFQYYFIALLPIQLYGFSIFGFTVKLFMVYAFVLFVYLPVKFKKRVFHTLRIPLRPLIILACVLLNLYLTDIINKSFLSSSFSAHTVLLITFFCLLVFFCSICDDAEWVSHLKNALVLSSGSFGSFFLLVFLLVTWGVNLPGFTFQLRVSGSLSDGIVGIYATSGVNQYRLRGFGVDPNEFASLFYLPSSLLFFSLANNRDKKSLFQKIGLLLINGANIAFSQSRTAYVVFALLAIGSLIYVAFLINRKYRVQAFIGASAVLLLMGITALIVAKGNIISFFASRSDPTDPYGRLTIWQTATKKWLGTNPIFGLGQGVKTNEAGLDCHNTWLEFLVGNGLFGGVPVLGFFAYVLVLFVLRIRSLYLQNNWQGKIDFLGIFFGFLSVIGAAFTFTFISSPDLWFSLLFGLSCYAYLSKPGYKGKNKRKVISYSFLEC